MERNFQEMLASRWEAANSMVCVGLDSEFAKIPEAAFRKGNECDIDIANTMVAFNYDIVKATHDLVCAYKINLAFYAAHGSEGINALVRTIIDIHIIDRDMPIILDGKFADIGNTNAGYAEFAFSVLHVDAITVHPYLGSEALQPFLDRAGKGIFVLCRTSNKGAGEFQDPLVPVPGTGHHVPMYQYVAHRVATEWNKNGNCGLVVGATYPGELASVRRIVDDMPILIPGIGAQGGDVEATVKAGADSKGRGMVINSSRSIIFASNGPDFAEVARRETIKLRDTINQYRNAKEAV